MALSKSSNTLYFLGCNDRPTILPRRTLVVNHGGDLRIGKLRPKRRHLSAETRAAYHFPREAMQNDMNVRIGIRAIHDRITCERRKCAGDAGTVGAVTSLAVGRVHLRARGRIVESRNVFASNGGRLRDGRRALCGG